MGRKRRKPEELIRTINLPSEEVDEPVSACPFCGKKDRLQVQLLNRLEGTSKGDQYLRNVQYAQVRCTHCAGRGPTRQSRYLAILSWNHTYSLLDYTKVEGLPRTPRKITNTQAAESLWGYSGKGAGR